MTTIPETIEIAGLHNALTGTPELSDENKERVCIIEDLARLRKLLGIKPFTTEQFYLLYDMSLSMLEAIQYNWQIEWNTVEYHKRLLNH